MVTIIIPARNEEQTILKTIDSLLKKVSIPYNLLVIDDGSTDSTAALVQSYVKKFTNIKILKTKGLGGFAKAILLGFKNSTGGFVIPVMADLCDDPATINKMYREMKKGYDIISGSRYIKGGNKIGGPAVQSFFSKFVGLSLKFITGIPTHDVSNSFKMYRNSFLKKLTLKQNFGVEFSMYLALLCYFNGARIKELPTMWKGREQGISKFKLLERSPKYLKIYIWAITQRIKQLYS